MLGPYCCCTPPDCAGLCNDATNIVFNVTLSGFSGTRADSACPLCADRDATYSLVYGIGPRFNIPQPPCEFAESSVTLCNYYYSSECYTTFIDPTYLDMHISAYTTTGGDRRLYLQVIFVGIGSTRIWYVSQDILMASGSTSIDCLSFTDSGTFTTCSDTGSGDCNPPTDWSIAIVEA
jgi:hypothetical protein